MKNGAGIRDDQSEKPQICRTLMMNLKYNKFALLAPISLNWLSISCFASDSSCLHTFVKEPPTKNLNLSSQNGSYSIDHVCGRIQLSDHRFSVQFTSRNQTNLSGSGNSNLLSMPGSEVIFKDSGAETGVSYSASQNFRPYEIEVAVAVMNLLNFSQIRGTGKFELLKIENENVVKHQLDLIQTDDQKYVYVKINMAPIMYLRLGASRTVIYSPKEFNAEQLLSVFSLVSSDRDFRAQAVGLEKLLGNSFWISVFEIKN